MFWQNSESLNNMISIIVPVYKVEKYLPECIESVLAQTYQDWELLLVDDGSPDSCPAICDEYAQKDSRIRAIHKENGGVSSARNRGLDEAKGEWVMFLDSDDTIAPTALGVLYNRAMIDNVDVVQFQASNTDEYGNATGSLSEISEDVVLSNYEYNQQVLEATVPLVIWDKLYKRTVIGEKRFDNGIKIGEDFLFLVKVFCSTVSRVLRIKDYLYNYRILSTSVTRVEDKNELQTFDAMLDGLVALYSSNINITNLQHNLFVEKIAILTVGSIRRQGLIKHVNQRHINFAKDFCKLEYIQDTLLRKKIRVLQSDRSQIYKDCYFTAIFLKPYLRKKTIKYIKRILR